MLWLHNTQAETTAGSDDGGSEESGTLIALEDEETKRGGEPLH